MITSFGRALAKAMTRPIIKVTPDLNRKPYSTVRIYRPRNELCWNDESRNGELRLIKIDDWRPRPFNFNDGGLK